MISARAAIEEHWQASERNDTALEHAIHAVDAVLDHPQSGERFRGRARIAAQRGGHPSDRHFTVVRIVGSVDLWVSECVITYDGTPTCSASIMEFVDELVVHETQFFADPLPGTRLAGGAVRADAGPPSRRGLRPGTAGSPPGGGGPGVAEGVGFEPTVSLPTAVFKTAAIGH